MSLQGEGEDAAGVVAAEAMARVRRAAPMAAAEGGGRRRRAEAVGGVGLEADVVRALRREKGEGHAAARNGAGRTRTVDAPPIPPRASGVEDKRRHLRRRRRALAFLSWRMENPFECERSAQSSLVSDQNEAPRNASIPHPTRAGSFSPAAEQHRGQCARHHA